MIKEAPYVVFLSETKLHESKIKKIQRKCGMAGSLGVSAEGRSGGLVMMWKKDTKLQLLSFFRNHVDMKIKVGTKAQPWRLTGIYGELDANRRKETWRLLRGLAAQYDFPWCCYGDFNEILWDHEKSGHGLRREK